jgi:regulator of sirC expression with transglutaminase-like and TPR domain
VLDRDAALKLLRQHVPGAELEPSHLEPLTPRATLARMQRNLKRIYIQNEDLGAALAASDRIVYLQPHDAEERRDRGMLFERLECFDAARRDYESYLEMRETGDDLATIRERMLATARRAALVN